MLYPKDMFDFWVTEEGFPLDTTGIPLTNVYFKTPVASPVATLTATGDNGVLLTKTGPDYTFTYAQKEIAGFFGDLLDPGFDPILLSDAHDLDEDYGI